MTERFRFRPCGPRLWTGRYGRIPGNGSVYHIRKNEQGDWWVEIEWNRQEMVCYPQALDRGDVQLLVESVNEAKRTGWGGQEGGSFLINEFRQVLVPSSDGSGIVMTVGETSGVLLFDDPSADSGETLDLSDDSGLTAGDCWDKPYIGSQYNLKAWNQIYYWREDEEGARSEHPPQQDNALIKAIRRVRPRGPVRFIVNEHGIVLTRVPPDGGWHPEEWWSPTYVGRIDHNLWFDKEQM